MRLKQNLCLLLILNMLLCLFAGCNKVDSDACIYFDLNTVPKTLDPQTAQSASELVIVRNLYEGLLRKDKNGKIKKGVCEDYSFKDNTYTFKLKKGLKWSNGDELCADDFLFAFTRAVDKKTASPFVSRLFCVKNAEEIYNGALEASSLGVKAEGKYTLKITLEYNDPDFKEALTTSICMPCNRDFFKESTGKYGLYREYVISNGSYFLGRWNKENFGIRLYANDEYKGSFRAKNNSVFISCRKENSAALLNGNKVDVAFVDNQEIEDIDKKSTRLKSFQNTCWVLQISEEYPIEIRKAFSMLISERGYSKRLSVGFQAADSIFPAVLNMKGASGVGVKDYDLETAQKLFSDAVKRYDDKKFPSTILYYYNEQTAKSFVTSVVGHWQQKLSAFVNIKPTDNLEALISDSKDGNISFGIYPIKVKSASVKEYLSNFGLAGERETAVSLQMQLLATDTIIPIAFENTNIGYNSLITEFYSDSYNGYIDFSFVTKK